MELVIGRAGERDFAVDAQELVTGRTCIIAQSGAGKSWSIAVVCEQLCRARVGFCLIDTEGEYFSLKDRFPVLWVGTDDACDVDIERVDLRKLMKNAICSRTAVVFDVSGTEMREKVAALTEILYEIESELKRPYLLIVEEADKFIPQSRDSIKKIEEISRRGRKRGLGLLIATQRPSLVAKNVLSQCNNQIIGKLSIENDLKAVSLFFSSRREVEELATLEPGEFFVMGGLAREKVKMRFAKRETEHRGLTPRLTPARSADVSGRPPTAPGPCNGDPHPPPPEPPAAEAVVPVLVREEALDIARGRRRRRFPFLGPDERIVSGERIYWPLIHVEVKYIGGLLKKATKTASFVLDGISGNLVILNRGMRIRPGFAELVGLDEAAIRIVSRLPPGGSTMPEMEVDTRLPPDAVRRAVKQLAQAKLITEMKAAGDATVYVPLLTAEIPGLHTLRQAPRVRLEPLREAAREPAITEGALRTILKALEPTAEITRFRVFYYPIYEVRLASGAGERTLFLDGVSGKDLPLSSA